MVAAVAAGYKISQGEKTWQMQFLTRAWAWYQGRCPNHRAIFWWPQLINISKGLQTTASFLT
jgi:hypothetical protein